MNKLLMGIIAMCMLTVSSLGAGVNVSTNAVSTESFYNAGEVGLTLGTGYVVDRATAFKTPYAVNVNAGAFWFPWKHFGFEANVPFYSTKGVSVSEIQAGVIARYPLSTSVFLLKNISPYVGVDCVYSWVTDANWAYVGKVGVDFRFNKKWGTFVEGQYRNTGTKWDIGQTSVVGGFKFVF